MENLKLEFIFSLNSLKWVGDGYCDPLSNKESCDFDGGDCCLKPIKDKWCNGHADCKCLETISAGT